MNKEEAREAIKESYGNSEYTDEIIKALEQEPCDTCGYEEGSIYCKEHCPHEAKIEQEPCEMTAEAYRQRMIQAFHNADTDELIAICVLPTEKEFEHLEWLLKNHYKKEPCGDAISRAEAVRVASGYCHPANVAKELAKLPSVNPTKTGWIPVSERMPEEYTYTLWCASSEYVRSDYFNGEFWEDAKKLGYEVIAWMPLPKPYEPQERSDKV